MAGEKACSDSGVLGLSPMENASIARSLAQPSDEMAASRAIVALAGELLRGARREADERARHGAGGVISLVETGRQV